ncbi:oligopeptide:H+ symporter [uncultured Brevundimonas sp.]|uniref:oligopeptide:H+ symporter n=1 Tax=uncultured Brevundimonas sp. TaxID=213418 RepID=UPI0026392522|nr:oligopeptide:H+ symporter [uncultured Brevundimonas sp.]
MSATESGGPLAVEPRKTILGHPRGLVILFLTEMWERFSYYGMRALLVLYLTQHFLFGPKEAQGIYAAYAALVYLMPVVGGMIADKYLGSRKAVIIGAVLLVFGHFMMAFEGTGGKERLTIGETTYELRVDGRDQDRKIFAVNGEQSTQIKVTPEGIVNLEAKADAADASVLPALTPSGEYKLETIRDTGFGEPILFFALSLIIVGVGFLKANISTVVGHLYEENDPRRDGGFTIFYVGINLGSLLATAACSYLGIKYGWAYGFGLAGIGMLLGLMTFIFGQSWLEGRGGPPNPEMLKTRKVLGLPFEAIFWIGGLVAVFPTWLLMLRSEIILTALPWLAGIIFAAVVGYSLIKLAGAERTRMLVALTLIFFSVLFWALFEQAGSSLTLFADQSTAMPSWFNAPMTQMFNPGIIVIGGPIMAALWVWLGKRNLEPSTPVKFSVALVLVGAGFLLLTFASNNFANVDFRVPLIFLFLTYLLHTLGELCLSPVGLSMITKLSVDRVVGLMMGVWFLSSSVAHIAAGLIAQATSSETVAGVVTNPEAALNTYAEIFGTIGWTGVAVGVVLLVLSPILKKGMAGVR